MNGLPLGSSLASPVHAAAITGDRAVLLRLIGSNADFIDQEDQLGRTPLMYSVLGDRRTCAEVLLGHGAQVNRSDRSGRTALHLAAQTGNHRLLKLLLSRKADCTNRDIRDITALHLSTRHQDTRCLALLLKHTPPGQVDAQDQRKQTALHWSAFYNRPRHVRLLVRHGSNIGIPDLEGKIPLHWAAGHKDPEAALTVRCLLEAAPTESLLNWQDYEGRTPLHLAVGDGNEEVVRLLTSYRGCNVAPYDNLFRTPLHWAALLGLTPIAHLLLERNNSPNIPSDSQGATPLHYAAQGNCPDTVRVLLAHPSVRDEADLEGRTAFMWAAGKGSDEAIKAMLELDPELEINRTDKYGGTALHAASLSGQITTVRVLLESGAQVDAADVMKHTPLFRACEMGHREVIHTLIKGGAKVQLVDKDGRSPLHWAALGGNANVCQILIENNINPNAQDYEGKTPLQCAAYGGYIGCMEVLIENKADPNIQDKNGRTALHWSCNNGYLDAVKLLLTYNAFPNQMENIEERYTPLDYALLGGHQEVIQFMLEHGALSIAAIQDIAASKIQAVYKGHKVRKAFRERKNLLMKHEQLRKGAAAKKREGENKRKTRVGQAEHENKREDNRVDSQGVLNNQEQDEQHHADSKIMCSKAEQIYKLDMERESEPWVQNRTVQQTSPRRRDVNTFPPPASPKTSLNAQPTPSASDHLNTQYYEDSPDHKHIRKKKASRRKRDSSDVMICTSGDYSHDQSSRKSNREISGSLTRRRDAHSHNSAGDDRMDALDIVGQKESLDDAKNTRANQHKMQVADIVQRMEACTVVESRHELSPSRGNEATDKVIERMLDCRNGLKYKDKAGKHGFHDRKSKSSQSKQRPITGKYSQTEERKTSGKAHRGASSLKPSPPGHSKTPVECKIIDGRPLSHHGFKRTLTVPLPRESVLGGHVTLNWQNMDIEMIPLEARLLLVEREKARKQLFQRKNQAATVIQKAWRSYRDRKRCNRKRPSRVPR